MSQMIVTQPLDTLFDFPTNLCFCIIQKAELSSSELGAISDLEAELSSKVVAVSISDLNLEVETDDSHVCRRFLEEEVGLDINTLERNYFQQGHLFGTGFKLYKMLEIRKNINDVRYICYPKCKEDFKCSGIQYRIDDRYDGRSSGNCWFMTGEVKHAPQALHTNQGGVWIKLPGVPCPELSYNRGLDGSVTNDASCTCTSVKSRKIKVYYLYWGYSCVLPYYSDTACTSPLDCDYYYGQCTSVSSFNHKKECIPDAGSAFGQSCYHDHNCASKECDESSGRCK
jgi:hypothetical protein